MTRHDIIQLLRLLPPGNAYAQWDITRDSSSPTELERTHSALNNPAWGRHIASAYAEADTPLPEGPWPETILRAHHFFSHDQTCDDDLMLAEVLHLVQNQAQAGLMHALLLCPDGTDERIGEVFQYRPDVVRLTDQLYYNVRDRRDEPLYLSFQLHALLAAGDRSSYELLRLACRGAGVSAVLAEAGLDLFACDTVPPEVSAYGIVMELLRLASLGLAEGRYSPDTDRALALAVKYLLGDCLQPPRSTDPLLGFQLNREFLQPVLDEIVQRLARTRGSTGEGVQTVNPPPGP